MEDKNELGAHNYYFLLYWKTYTKTRKVAIKSKFESIWNLCNQYLSFFKVIIIYCFLRVSKNNTLRHLYILINYIFLVITLLILYLVSLINCFPIKLNHYILYLSLCYSLKIKYTN